MKKLKWALLIVVAGVVLFAAIYVLLTMGVFVSEILNGTSPIFHR